MVYRPARLQPLAWAGDSILSAKPAELAAALDRSLQAWACSSPCSTSLRALGVGSEPLLELQRETRQQPATQSLFRPLWPEYPRPLAWA